MAVPSQTELEKAAVQSLLLENCGTCHGASVVSAAHSLAGVVASDGSDTIADIGDIDGLVDSGFITPGWPEESPLLLLMASGQMPPVTSGLAPVSAPDLRRVEKFIVRMNPPTQREVVEILLRNCGSCHESDSGKAVVPINDIGDVGVLAAAGLIVPGDRDRSPIYTLAEAFDMPPRDSGLPPVSNRDLARLGGFIDLMR
jgi:hypothetical protein